MKLFILKFGIDKKAVLKNILTTRKISSLYDILNLVISSWHILFFNVFIIVIFKIYSPFWFENSAKSKSSISFLFSNIIKLLRLKQL